MDRRCGLERLDGFLWMEARPSRPLGPGKREAKRFHGTDCVNDVSPREHRAANPYWRHGRSPGAVRTWVTIEVPH
jgi:hypothetical protein